MGLAETSTSFPDEAIEHLYYSATDFKENSERGKIKTRTHFS
jgi:hypothetical protein